MRLFLTTALLLTVAGCDQPASVQPQHNETAPVAAPKPAPPAPPAKPLKISEESDLFDYGFSYPAEVAAIPALANRLSDDAAREKADALKVAAADRKEMKASGFPFNAHSLESEWSVAGNTHRFLSLVEESYVFTGGAHGMTGYAAMLWDKQTGKDAEFAVMATADFPKVIQTRFCKALNAARLEKRGEPTPPDDEFGRCVDPMKQTLVPTSSDGKLLDGLKVVIGPYEAGPFAEGSYDVDLPFDAAMLGAIRQDYRGYFGVAKDSPR